MRRLKNIKNDTSYIVDKQRLRWVCVVSPDPSLFVRALEEGQVELKSLLMRTLNGRQN